MQNSHVSKGFMLFANCYAVPGFLTSKKCRTGTVLGLLMISKKCGTGRVSSRTGLHDVLEIWNYWMSDTCWSDNIKYRKVYPNYRHENDLCINWAAQINKYKYIKQSTHKKRKT
jgi:hypothetical protein